MSIAEGVPDPPPDLVEIAEDLDAMRTAEAVSLLFILF